MNENEFSIIERYFKTISSSSEHVVLGSGDDCAVLQVPQGMELCVSTDTLLEGVHFPNNAAAAIVANRSLGANLSDLAAMGAVPHAFVLAMTLPRIDERWIADFAAQLTGLTQEFSIPLVGGNMSRGPLSLTLTVMGVVPEGQAVRRDSAQINDDIWVSGQIGQAGLGLEDILLGKVSAAVASYTSPIPRIALGVRLRGIATAMIDVSDGLAADVTHLISASKVGAEIHLDDIPFPSGVSDIEQKIAAVTAGDDYELCFTAPPGSRQEIDLLAHELSLPVTRIGTVISAGTKFLLDGKEVPIGRRGYDHFRVTKGVNSA